MAYYGATVIHPKTIQPLQSKNIPLYVKSFLDPKESGTLVGIDKSLENLPSTIISKGNQVLLSISSKDFSFIVEDNLSKIFTAFAQCKVKINLMQNSAISFIVCLDNEREKIDQLKEFLDFAYSIKINEGLELLTISNYNAANLEEIIGQRDLLIEQKAGSTLQIVIN
jgi:aspartate kinase